MRTPDDLEVGQRYVLLHKTATQRKARRSCMTYLGQSYSGERQFSARPGAGTQTLRDEHILALEPVDDSQAHYLNKTTTIPGSPR